MSNGNRTKTSGNLFFHKYIPTGNHWKAYAIIGVCILIVLLLSRIPSINFLIVFLVALIPTSQISFYSGQRWGVIASLLISLVITASLIQRQSNPAIAEISLPLIFLGAGLLVLAGFVTGFLIDSSRIQTRELDHISLTALHLAQEKDRILEILNRQQDLICRFDQDLHILYMNPIGYEFFNLTAEDLHSITLVDLIESKYRPRFKDYMHNFNRSQASVHPELILLPILNHTGQKQYFEWSVSLIGEIDEHQREYQVAGRNITIQHMAKMAEKENLEIAESLKSIAATLNSTLDIDDVLGKVLETIGRVVPHNAANIMLIENEHARMVKLVGYEKFIPNLDAFRATRFPVELYNLKMMAETKNPVYVADLDQDSNWRHIEGNQWMGSYLGAPLIFKENLIGFLNLDSARKNFYTEKHISWLQAFANQAAIAIKNAQYFDETKRQTLHFAGLNEAMRISIHATEISEILDPLQRIFNEQFNLAGMHAFLWDENNLTYRTQPVEPQNHATHELLFDSQTADAINSNGEILYLPDGNNENWTHPEVYSPPSNYPQVLLPLVVDHRKLGVIHLWFNPTTSLSTSELELMQQFALQLSLAISKIQLLTREMDRSQEIAHKSKMLETLTLVSTVVELNLALPDLFANIITALGQNGIGCLAAILQEDWRSIHIYRSSESNDPIQVENPFLRLTSSAEQTSPRYFTEYQKLIQNKEPLFFEQIAPFIEETRQLININNDAGKIPALFSIPVSDQGFVIPMAINDQVIGMLVLWSNLLQPGDQSSVNIFATQTANAIEKSRLYLQIAQLAITDPLTGFYNRRGLEELGSHEIERSTRFSNHLSAIMIDIDHFKIINDRYGHPLGDKVLEKMAFIIRSNLRHVDIICRYGGEEFFILLPEANSFNAQLIAERLRKAIAEEDFAPQVGPIRATISVGICQLTKEINTLAKLIQCTDQALYQAKYSGRNRVYQHEC